MLHARSYLTPRALTRSYVARRWLRAHSQVTNEPITPTAQPTVRSDDVQQTLRTRQHGAKSLPLPPLMDPVAVDAKEQHTAPRPRWKDGPKTQMQVEMELNPFGIGQPP